MSASFIFLSLVASLLRSSTRKSFLLPSKAVVSDAILLCSISCLVTNAFVSSLILALTHSRALVPRSLLVPAKRTLSVLGKDLEGSYFLFPNSLSCTIAMIASVGCLYLLKYKAADTLGENFCFLSFIFPSGVYSINFSFLKLTTLPLSKLVVASGVL